MPQSGVQPPPAHGARCPGEQEARALGPASHMEARAPDAHRPRCARLPHSARSSARCAAHRPGTRPDCVQYQSDLRGACGPQDGCKLTKNIVPAPQMRSVFFRVSFGVSLKYTDGTYLKNMSNMRFGHSKCQKATVGRICSCETNWTDVRTNVQGPGAGIGAW